MSQLIIKQVKSQIGSKPMHRKVMASLGLRKIGQITTQPDNPQTRGKIAKIVHLVTVEEHK
jgi:large subunit ribosomal protein L30